MQPAKGHSVNPKHLPTAEVAKGRTNASKPLWLLALEIATGTIVGILFVIALFTASQKWKRRHSVMIPWKKSSSAKDDDISIYIGWCLRT